MVIAPFSIGRLRHDRKVRFVFIFFTFFSSVGQKKKKQSITTESASVLSSSSSSSPPQHGSRLTGPRRCGALAREPADGFFVVDFFDDRRRCCSRFAPRLLGLRRGCLRRCDHRARGEE